MAEQQQCWQCGQGLEGLLLPVSRRETCDACGADVHVCKQCKHYDGRYCNEQRAEPPNDKEKANFCDYFSFASNAYQGGYQDKSAIAKAKLAALFGDSPEPPTEESQVKPCAEKTPAELAEEKLRKLLGGE
ncbi:hypothetical protein KJY73_02550 [Bowmanella sp. Y26]|uniref:hypothetical protein n=1 Tax=Bowmanella yangjiangensis TaxID=2811230 RepID=UPI001BDD260B|nr:hypothetical protein [Bowmanella yangjiangensis]MBT1062432.1 hypothetical protein [Bowmanella yangjiangensis]